MYMQSIARTGKNQSRTDKNRNYLTSWPIYTWPYKYELFTRRFFKIQPIRNKNFPWQPYYLSNQDERRKPYRGPSIIDASYHVSVHLVKQFQRRRFFRNWQTRNKNCLWWPYLLTDRNDMSNLNRIPSIDGPFQVLVHLAKRWRGLLDHDCKWIELKWAILIEDLP